MPDIQGIIIITKQQRENHMQKLNEYINDLTQTGDLDSAGLRQASNDFLDMASAMRGSRIKITIGGSIDLDLAAILGEEIDALNAHLQEQADYLVKMATYFVDCADEEAENEADEAEYVREVSSPYLSGRV
jgi:hypothetical protein